MPVINWTNFLSHYFVSLMFKKKIKDDDKKLMKYTDFHIFVSELYRANFTRFISSASLNDGNTHDYDDNKEKVTKFIDFNTITYLPP